MRKRSQAAGPFARDIAVDLGTSSVVMVMRGRGILLHEPSVVAADRQTGKVLQAGSAARDTLGLFSDVLPGRTAQRSGRTFTI